MSGTFKVDGSGNVDFKEEDGIDYAPVTVQLPGGERVPFLFTVKELQAKGSLEGFGGDFVVPSYRGSSFLDPKVSRLGSRCKVCHDPLPWGVCLWFLQLRLGSIIEQWCAFLCCGWIFRSRGSSLGTGCLDRLHRASSFSGHLAICCIWCRATAGAVGQPWVGSFWALLCCWPQSQAGCMPQLHHTRHAAISSEAPVTTKLRRSKNLTPHKHPSMASWLDKVRCACLHALEPSSAEPLPLQGRGGSTGYDNAVALPARSDSDELAKENTKSTVALKGQAVFSVAKIDTETNEIAGELDLGCLRKVLGLLRLHRSLVLHFGS